jgi:outer membrane protein assembly factor BamA
MDKSETPTKRNIIFGTHIQTDGRLTNLCLNLTAPNLTGLKDKISLALKSNNGPKVNAIDFDYSIPISLPYNPVYSIGYSQFVNTSLPSAYDQESKSFINNVDIYSNKFLKHSISFINTWTQIRSSSAETPLVIREQSGHFLKSYLRYAIQFDNRKPDGFLHTGVLSKLSTDLTTNLFKKAARFGRLQAQVQANALLLPQHGLYGEFYLFAGTLLKASKTDISDKFFPGGVPTFRGYRHQSFGPHIREHPLGVISYLTAGLHLYPIFPGTTTKSKINDIIRPNIFVNIGTTGDISRGLRATSFSDLKLSDSLRCSCGVGLVSTIMGVRFELNYCLPVKTNESDLIVSGLQFGFYSDIAI